jgi:hypothetical protein
MMTLAYRFLRWRETHGQDLIEYALLAGFCGRSCWGRIPTGGSSHQRDFLPGNLRNVHPEQLVSFAPQVESVFGVAWPVTSSRWRIGYSVVGVS